MEQTRNKSIYMRATQREKEKITAKATKCGLSLSEYIRQVCLGYEPKEIFKADLPETIDLNIIGELNLSSKNVTVKPRKNAFSNHLQPISFDIKL